MRCVNGDKQIKSQVKNTIIKNGKEFRDLNGNGIVAPYENWELPIEEWVQGLLSRMTLEENHPFSEPGAAAVLATFRLKY